MLDQAKKPARISFVHLVGLGREIVQPRTGPLGPNDLGPWALSEWEGLKQQPPFAWSGCVSCISKGRGGEFHFLQPVETPYERLISRPASRVP